MSEMDRPMPENQSDAVQRITAPALVVTPETEEAQIAERSEEALRTEGNRSEEALRSDAKRTENTIRFAGQRRVNLIWESTQAAIALSVVLSTSLGILAVRLGWSTGSQLAFPPEWWTVLGLVIGFYFGRTNHARIGDDSQENKSK